MARKLSASMPLDDIEDEILFTTAALRADPDAQHLLPMTEGWMPKADNARAFGRKVRGDHMGATAARIVANSRLDEACVGFGDELHRAVRKDTKSPRWKQFFKLPVSRFVRRALSDQTQTVRGWLTSDDAALADHREGLQTWADASDAALEQTEAVGMTRGQSWQVREQLAEDLTRERDALRDTLAGISRERNLPRTWSDLFFLTGSPSKSIKETEPS
jgi:hypothetical protein